MLNFQSKQQESMDKDNISSFDTLDFQLKSKTSSKPESKIMQSNEIYSLATPSTNTAKDKIKVFFKLRIVFFFIVKW